MINISKTQVKSLKENFIDSSGHFRVVSGRPVLLSDTGNNVGPELFPVDFIVEGKQLITALNRFAGKDLKITGLDETGGVLIETEDGKKQVGLTNAAPEIQAHKERLTDIVEEWSKLEFYPISPTMKRALDVARTVAEKNWNQGALCCLQIKDQRIHAAGSFRVYRSPECDEIDSDVEMYIASQSVPNDFEFFSDISVTKDWIVFKNPEIMVGLPHVGVANFPDVLEILTEELDDPVYLNLSNVAFEDMIAVCKTSKEFSEDLAISMDTKGATLRGDGDSGYYVEDIEFEEGAYEGAEIHFICTVPVLQNILARVTSESTIELTESLLRVDVDGHAFAASLSVD